MRGALCRARCYLPSVVAVFLGEDRRDRQRRVDERDLDVAIPLTPLDEGPGGEQPFAFDEMRGCSEGRV